MNYFIWFHIHPYSPIFDVCRWTSCLKTVIGALFARIPKENLQILLDRQVMLTRARRGLLIFGNAATLKQDTKGLISHWCYSAWVCVCVDVLIPCRCVFIQYQDVSGCIKMYQDVSRCIKMYQDVSRCIKMYQVVDADMSLHMFILQWAASCEMGTA